MIITIFLLAPNNLRMHCLVMRGKHFLYFDLNGHSFQSIYFENFKDNVFSIFQIRLLLK